MTWSKCLWVPFPYCLLFPTFPKGSWGVLYDKLTVVWGRLKILSKTKVMEELQSSLQMFWRIFKYHSNVDICNMSGYMYHVYVSVWIGVQRPVALDTSGAISCLRWVLEMRSLNYKQIQNLTKKWNASCRFSLETSLGRERWSTKWLEWPVLWILVKSFPLQPCHWLMDS